jgi:hypothetical protein
MKPILKNKTETITDTRLTYYNDVDELPLWNFKKVIETKETTFLIKVEGEKAEPDELNKAWGRISEQAAQLSGVSDIQQKFIMLQSDIESLTIDYLVNRDANLVTLIKTKQRELDRMLERFNGGNANFDEQIAAVEVFFKFQIDERKTTVKRFLTYVNIIQKQHNGRR